MDRDARAALEALPVQPLLQEALPAPSQSEPDPVLRRELEQFAGATDALADRSERLWQLLRKRLGQPEALELLRGVVLLARAHEPAGARLLAALLDVHAPGAELIVHIHRFDSSRRLCAQGRARRGAVPEPPAWRRQLDNLVEACSRRADELPGRAAPAPAGPRGEAPLPLLRRWLEHLLAELARRGDLDERDTALLIGLARVEVDAYAERVSRAASSVNPYLASAVSRLLPRLSEADAQIRSMREFIQSLEAGRAGVAFRQRLPRLHDTLTADERARLLRSLEGQPGLADLLVLLRGLDRHAMPIRRLAGAAARLMALAASLRARGLRRTDLDLLSAVLLAQRHERDGQFHLPLGVDLAATVSELLAPHGDALTPNVGADAAAAVMSLPARDTPLALPLGDAEAAAALLVAATSIPVDASRGAVGENAGGVASWPLDGFRLAEGELILRVPQEGRADRIWRDDLPLPTTATSDQESVVPAELDTAELKRLVLAHLDNVSVTSGFLRNARVTAIPGLVAMVAVRCRSSRILELIASDRTLYTGYANKDVPRSLLTSPCNIPVKCLVKFIHVKYVSRMDLQRMAKDKTGIRREVIQEIQNYLETLGNGS